MRRNKRHNPKQSKERGRRTEASRKKLAENFLARLERSWRLHGDEMLERLAVERPKVLFRALAKLTEALYRRLPEPPDFDRRHCRADVLQRMQERRL